MDFGELKNDSNFVAKVQSVSQAITRIEKTIKETDNLKVDEISTEDKINLDLFLSYSINSLYFMFLKIEGDDPNAVSIIKKLEAWLIHVSIRR